MSRPFKIFTTLGATLVVLGGCAAQHDLMPDYGKSVRQNIASQTADPEANYRRDLPAASNGERTFGAQERYAKGQVIQPSSAGASNISKDSSAGGQPSSPALGK